ncbi:hypothetical protein [Chelativorans salis]|uniref:Uncharacterized protein n=1 Tax=Chelativorans salis TaxID=2978478 RepID=A0ABT2LWL3_9HYPH|nr:hypothetical protein [Chelativorans sp. EGI FJ00035]MCT7378267.1 hypothetical protein [Chelativorans sp. EGI FJ00035]
MTDLMTQANAMRDAFDRIEESYEFMLAYAAQGRKRDMEEGGGESQIRRYLKRFNAALDDLEQALDQGLADPEGAAFRDRFRADLAVVRSVLAVLLAQPSISSDMIDNTNGLISVRSLLTNIFFTDQAVLPPR